MLTKGKIPHEPNTAAILLSRQPLRPCGQTPWVTKVVEAVSWIREQKLTLLSSVGMQTWEMITAVGSRLNLDMNIYLDSACATPEAARKILTDFALSSETPLIPLKESKALTPKKRCTRETGHCFPMPTS